MKLQQAIKMAFKSILGNKGRSFLTMLGIIIGIASVMTIVSTVNGMNQQSLKQFEAMGTNKIEVSAYLYNGQNTFDSLYDYCNSLGSDLVLGVTPNAQFNATVVYGSKSSKAMEKNQENMWNGDGTQNSSVALPPTLYFGSDQYAVCNNFQIAAGRDLSNIDIKNYNQVCILGARAAQNFFNYANPVGQTMQVNGLPFTVVGVYAEKDPDSSWSMDNLIVFPYTLSRTLNPGSQMNDFVVKAASNDAAVEATSRISGFLSGLTNNGNSGWGYANSNNQWQNSQNEYTTMISMVLGGIAAISLLVGGIGIMNIMLVTVTERTREIGIRRAIGAERSSIVTQFLIEAAMLCGIGGVIGIAIGTAGTRIAGKLLMKITIWPSLGITLCAFLLSVVLGILFGIYPAAKASKLQPVEALRAE
ncbi:ABC transporter permease [Dysosmobacter sp.]